MKFTVEQIAQLLGGRVEGEAKAEVSSLSKIEEGKPGSIAFLSNEKYEQYLYTTEATAVIVKDTLELKKPVQAALIRVADPYSSFTVLLEEYARFVAFAKSGVEEPAYLGSNSLVGEGGYRGAFSYIGNNCRIGKNVKIYPQAYIGDNVEIGDNTIIFPGAKVYADCKIGAHCTLHAGAVIGSDGFGFAPQADGSYKAIPQLGNVVLEDWVSIGANTTVDCATLGSTTIRQGVKLDNLVQIAHNTEINKNTVVAAQTGIAGSTKIGENCVIGGQVGIAGHIQIADRTSFAAQSGIGTNINKPGTILMGSPGFEHREYLKSYALFRKLPQIQERLRELEEKVINLQASAK
jgi:UDP-3-O-[3-hydroxymyristoyl] glucosamine N-acyltransferase